MAGPRFTKVKASHVDGVFRGASPQGYMVHEFSQVSVIGVSQESNEHNNTVDNFVVFSGKSPVQVRPDLYRLVRAFLIKRGKNDAWHHQVMTDKRKTAERFDRKLGRHKK